MHPLRIWLDRGSLIAVIVALSTSFAACAADASPSSQDTLAARTITQFETNTGVFPGYRRNHAKGVCISGYFQSSGKATPYSIAQVFAPGQRTPVTGRLSIPGTNPYSWDTSTPIRGMALQLTQANGQQWRTAMNAVPAFPVSTPEANYAFLQAQQPDPATGNPDPEKLAAFFASHPHSNAFRTWVQTTQPSASFATVRYNSLNTFILVDMQGHKRPVRWSMVPEATADNNATHAVEPDYLAADLRQRLQKNSLRWRLVVIFANPGDSINNAAIAWTGTHQRVDAGTLVITASQPQATGPCRDTNFNPLILPDGIEPSDDPLLHFRADVYAESHRRRVREVNTSRPEP